MDISKRKNQKNCQSQYVKISYPFEDLSPWSIANTILSNIMVFKYERLCQVLNLTNHLWNIENQKYAECSVKQYMPPFPSFHPSTTFCICYQQSFFRYENYGGDTVFLHTIELPNSCFPSAWRNLRLPVWAYLKTEVPIQITKFKEL